jgi:hypothetical protein
MQKITKNRFHKEKGINMWDTRFWILFIVVLLIAVIVAVVRKLRFIDIQLMTMIATIVLACDMLFCKQFKLYSYISIEYKGWYSFWANLLMIPALGLIFVKLAPKNIIRVILYIAVWVVASAMFEIFIAKPLGIVLYPKWRIIPYSPIGYSLLLTWIYIYYGILLNKTK